MQEDQWTGVEVFSTTKHQERLKMGEVVTEWRRRNLDKTIVKTEVKLSSDSEFHCMALVVFYK